MLSIITILFFCLPFWSFVQCQQAIFKAKSRSEVSICRAASRCCRPFFCISAPGQRCAAWVPGGLVGWSIPSHGRRLVQNYSNSKGCGIVAPPHGHPWFNLLSDLLLVRMVSVQDEDLTPHATNLWTTQNFAFTEVLTIKQSMV